MKKTYVKVIKAFKKTEENKENIYKIMNAWLMNCRSIFNCMKKQIKDTKRKTEREMLGE